MAEFPAGLAPAYRLVASDLALADGAPVDTWASAQGPVFTQATATKQPTRQTVTVEGKTFPVLRFDGTSDSMAGDLAARSALAGVPGATVLAVVNVAADTPASGRIWSEGTAANAGSSRRTIVVEPDNQWSHGCKRLDADTYQAEQYPGSLSNGFWQTVTAIQEGPTRDVRGLGNGRELVPLADVLIVQTGNTDSLPAGGVAIGALGTGNGSYARMDLAELIVFARALAPAELSAVLEYVADTYGRFGTEYLGTGHAYGVADPEIWLDGSTLTGPTGTAVAEWPDRSGNTQPARQVTAAKRPTVLRDGLNGQTGVAFDGVDDWLKADLNAVGGLNTTQAYEVFVVFRSELTSRMVAQFRQSNSGTPLRGFMRTDGQTHHRTNAGGLTGVLMQAADTVERLWGTAWNSTTFRGYRGGVEQGSVNTTGATNTNRLIVGGDTANDGGTVTALFQGVVYEYLAFSRQLSAAERAEVSSRLSDKYGLGLTTNYVPPARPGPTATVQVAAPPGEVSAGPPPGVSLQGPTASTTAAAPLGAVSTGAAATQAGPTATVATTAPPGTVGAERTAGAAGPAAPVAASAPPGAVTAATATTVAAPTAQTTAQAPPGAVVGSAGAALTAPPTATQAAAPPGTVAAARATTINASPASAAALAPAGAVAASRQAVVVGLAASVAAAAITGTVFLGVRADVAGQTVTSTTAAPAGRTRTVDVVPRRQRVELTARPTVQAVPLGARPTVQVASLTARPTVQTVTLAGPDGR